MNIILFLIILGVLVLVHEWGHFIAAKKAGIRVDEFAIGFPPRLFSWRRGETLYSLNLLPIGGFVKIFGENPGNSNSESIEGPDKEKSFIGKSRYIQALVLAAGVLMNILFAWALFSLSITIGLPIPNGYAGDKELVGAKVAVIEVLPDSPAEKAGIRAGDRIISIKRGEEILKTARVEDVQKFIAAGRETLAITLQAVSGGEEREVNALPSEGIVAGKVALGVSLGQVGTLKLPFFESILEAGKITLYMLGAVSIGLFELIRGALLGQADLSQITGPVGIVSLVGDASVFGLAYLLGFVAMISVNLAVINLIPFPALDGGRLLFVAIEGITRRRIMPVVANVTNMVGFALLMVLMIVITYKDITRLF